MTDLDLAGGSAVAVPEDSIFDRFTADWLAERELSDETRAAYRRDVHEYIAWCAGMEINPVAAGVPTINKYRGALLETPNHWTGKPPTKTTVARKLAAVSSWYRYLHQNGHVDTNPVILADRPKFDRDYTASVGFTAAEGAAMVRAAADDHWLGQHGCRALISLMLAIGCRVSDICRLEVPDLDYNSGHRTVLLRHMKGGKKRDRSLPPSTGEAIDAYLAERGQPETGLFFVRPDGAGITRQEVARLVTRVARAASLPAANRITPHSFRHAWNTIAKKEGAALEDRQYLLGHVDPRTTQRYDRSVAGLENDASYLVAAALLRESK